MIWLLLLPLLVTSRSVFVSSPFDNFRIECNKRAAVIEVSIKMVESVGAKRQDVVFEMSCEHIEELYPWVNMPEGIIDMEREDCYYSPMFDPILDSSTNYTCKNREYMAGITRLTDTRVQVMCCRLRSREEFNCQEVMFNKPLGETRSTIIEHDNQLINGLRVDERGYSVRFCDLSPRNIPAIYEDVKSTTAPSHVKTTPKQNIKVHKVAKPDLQLVTLPRNPAAPNRVTVSPIQSVHSGANRFVASSKFSQPELETFEEVIIDDGKMPEYTPTKSPQLARVTPKRVELVPPTIVVPEVPSSSQESSEMISSAEVLSKPNSIVVPSPPLEDIIKKIETASSERTADKLFKESVTAILNKEKKIQKTTTPTTTTTATTTTATTTTTKATTTTTEEVVVVEAEELPVDTPPPLRPQVVHKTKEVKESTTQRASNEIVSTVEKSMEDITMDDVSRVTFANEDFPKPNQKKLALPGKLKLSKSELPLRKGQSPDDFVFLKPINAGGHRRAPIRPLRPHVDIWSSEEDDADSSYGSVEFVTEEPPPHKLLKLRKKVARAHRLEEAQKENEVSVDVEQSGETPLMSTGAKSEEREKNTESVIRYIPKTSSSMRKDLPSEKKKNTGSMKEQLDNARSVDEETLSSPFEDQTEVQEIMRRPKLIRSETTGIEFTEDEDLEDVILRMTAKRKRIGQEDNTLRRAPVHQITPPETLTDKHEEISEKIDEEITVAPVIRRKIIRRIKSKDGSRVYKTKTEEPMTGEITTDVPITVFEKYHTDAKPSISKEKQLIVKNRHSDANTASSESLILMKSKKFVGDTQTTTQSESKIENDKEVSGEIADETTVTEVMTTIKMTTTTSAYDPANFYHTPRPKPAKKEKILTFCTKEVAIRDERNMVIACGGELDVWSPSRCPQGTDCFLAHDSTYRICCPISKG